MAHHAMDALIAWVQNEGGWIDGSSIRMCNSSGHQYVVAKTPLSMNKELVHVPKHILLSPANSANKQALQQLDEHTALVFALVPELLYHDSSAWTAYLGTIPLDGERSLPMYWSSAFRNDFLCGTELLPELDKDDTQHSELMQLMQQMLPSSVVSNTSFDTLRAAISLVSSRAFRVPDGVHKECMVPVADLFNNAVTNEHVHIETGWHTHAQTSEDDDSDSNHSGATDTCTSEHMTTSKREEDDDEEDEDEDLEKVIYVVDDITKETEEHAEQDAAHDDGHNDHSNECACCTQRSESLRNMLSVTTVRCAEPSEELFNTFGQQGNARLLHRYGYCELGPAAECTEIAVVNIDIQLAAECLNCESKQLKHYAIHFGFGESDDSWQVSYFGEIESSLAPAMWCVIEGEKKAESLIASKFLEDSPTELLSGYLSNRSVNSKLQSILGRRLQQYKSQMSAQEERDAAKSLKHQHTAAGGGFVFEAACHVLRASEKQALENALQMVYQSEPEAEHRHRSKAQRTGT